MKKTLWILFNKVRSNMSSSEMRNLLLMVIYLNKYWIKFMDLIKEPYSSQNLDELKKYIIAYEKVKKNNEIDEKYLKLYLRCYEQLKEFKVTRNLDLSPFFSVVTSIQSADLKSLARELINIDDDFEKNSVDELNELVYMILSDAESDDIVDMCSGVGSFLGYAGEKDSSLKLIGQEINMNSLFISELYLAINDFDFDIYSGDLLKNNQLTSKKPKFHRLYSNFPWLLKLRNNDIESIDNSRWFSLKYDFTTRNTTDWIFSTILVNMMSEEGKAVALVANGSLFKLTDSEIREEYISKGLIEAVIQLPENIFSYTSISTSLLVFSHNNKSVKFVDASKLFEKERRVNILKPNEIYDAYKNGNPDLVISVTNKEILKNDSGLLVSNYAALNDLKLVNPTPLEDVVETVFRGYQITASQLDKYIVHEKDEPFNYEVLQLSDIEEGVISTKLIKINSQDKKLEKYLLKDGDIVISAKSSKVKSAVVDLKANQKVVATGSILVIRPNERLNSAYLKIFFDSNEGKILLNSIQTGSVIVSINPSQLLKMNISLPSKEKQEKLGNKYLAKLDLIKITRSKLRILEQEIQNIYDLESIGD